MWMSLVWFKEFTKCPVSNIYRIASEDLKYSGEVEWSMILFMVAFLSLTDQILIQKIFFQLKCMGLLTF